MENTFVIYTLLGSGNWLSDLRQAGSIIFPRFFSLFISFSIALANKDEVNKKSQCLVNDPLSF